MNGWPEVCEYASLVVGKALAVQLLGPSQLLFVWTISIEEKGPTTALMQKINASEKAGRL
jgi:hypothetical protein